MPLPSTFPPAEPGAGRLPRLAVLEPNRAVAQRIARVVRAASGFEDVVVESDPATLRSQLADDPILLACDAADLDVALEWAATRYPDLAVVAWSSTPMGPLLEVAARSNPVASLVGWPSFASMPRPWEIALATRRLVDPSARSPRLAEMLGWSATVEKLRPRTSAERDAAVSRVVGLAERAGAATRLAQRVGEVAHEMLMNAMYDAPVDEFGQQRYAHDRKRPVHLADPDVPTLRFGSDGIHVALQVVDPFGRLERRHVLEGIERGLAGGLDTSGGGAGLGFARMYAQSSVLVVDIAPGRFTSVTAFFDMDVNPREARSLPVSLHLFDGGLHPYRRPGAEREP